MRRITILALGWFLLCSQAQEVAPTSAYQATIDDLDSQVAELRKAFKNESWGSLDAEGIAARLARIVELDQFGRTYFMNYSGGREEGEMELILERLRQIDRANTQEVRDLIAAHGWPVVSRFGKRADEDAWMLVQHADHDRDFQHETLELLERLVGQGETNAANFARLYDRVAVADDRPQRYGTQFSCAAADVLSVGELEDEENVDALRAGVGLGPLEDHVQRMVEDMGDTIRTMCANWKLSQGPSTD